MFKINALLDLPEGLTDDELRHDLEALANEMMVGIEVEAPAGGA
jgi:glycine cleavage system regulatory protein